MFHPSPRTSKSHDSRQTFASKPNPATIDELAVELATIRTLLDRTLSKLEAVRGEQRERQHNEIANRAVPLSEAMKILGKSRHTIWREIKIGKLTRLPGGRVLFAMSELQRYLASTSPLDE